MTHGCRKLQETFLHAYVDGEFSPEESAEVKAHLDECGICTQAVRLHRSYKAAMLRANAAAPHLFYDGVRERIAAESPGRWTRAFQRPSAVAVAAACVGAAAWFLAGGLTRPIFTARHSLVDDGIAIHKLALPLDFPATDPRSAQQWLESKLDYGVRVPRFAQQGPRLQGVRLSSVHERRAALVTYSLPQSDGRRVSLLIVDDPEPQLAGDAHRVADREVWLSRAKGFNVASWRNNEIVYSLITDLDEQDVLALVQSAEMR